MKVHFFLSQTAQFDKSINLFFSFLNNRIFVCSIFFTTDAISVHYFYIGYSTEVWGFLFLFFISSHFVKTLFIETSLSWLISQPANIGPQDVPRTSLPTSPGRTLKILFDRPGTSRSNVPGTSQSNVLGTSLNDVQGTS